MKTDIRALLAGLQIDAAGQLSHVRGPSDQRYYEAFSGLYWQISRDGTVIQRSRSLWDEKLVLPADVLPGGDHHQHRINGPRVRPLLAVEQAIAVSREPGDFVLRVTAALDAGEITSAVKAFRGDLVFGLAGIGLTLLIAFWVALGVGLAPLTRLRIALGLLRSGEASRLAGHYPSEVAPLVDDLNDLLDLQENLVEKAKARAGNLAHGLKTPLTAISVLAQDLEVRSERETADELFEHVSSMQRHIEHELALARSAHSNVTSNAVALREFVDRLVHTMQRLPCGSDLDWSVNIDNGLTLRIDEITLGEVVGNILDNARKWARSRIQVSATSTSEWVELTISDDGPGVPATEREQIIDRGKRLDQSQPGSGLGLSIVSEIMGQIGGHTQLSQSELGGLSVAVSFAV